MTSLDLPSPGRSAAPRMAYGPGAIHQLAGIVEELGGDRALLVCGKNSFEASGAADALPALENVADVCRWSDFRPNTDSEDLAVGLEVLADFAPDVVVAVGGGSALDMAKLLVSYAHLGPDEVVPAIEGGVAATERSTHLVLAPTTSGSGAEATHFAVVYVGESKYSIAGPAMRADAIVLDPSLTLSGSRYQRATSGIDAVAQAIESLWAVGATDRSRRFARHALRLLLPAISDFVNDGNEHAARAMAIGSHLAGRAIDISKTTAAHALSYGLTKQHGISHGHAVALTLGAFIEAHSEADVPTQTTIDPDEHARAMATIQSYLSAPNGSSARASWRTLCVGIGLDMAWEELGISPPSDIDKLARSVNVERLGNNPVPFTSASLQRLLTGE